MERIRLALLHDLEAMTDIVNWFVRYTDDEISVSYTTSDGIVPTSTFNTMLDLVLTEYRAKYPHVHFVRRTR